ncbi:hypothetical protein [Cellulophaga sp. Ld12]|uniref:hypothetical protein n=1 Tax=Cellulophaga sp. Ld12 TaxID=3229535 RepID=UPI003866519C
MKLIEKEIEDWIKPYATIVGEKIDVDIDLKKKNPVKYFLRLTLPNKFQDYGIALHSYWINYNIPKSKIRERKNDDEELPEEEFTRVNWQDFYKLKDVPFKLNAAVTDSVEWKKPNEQLNNELYPGEGLMDEEHLKSFVNIVNELYGNQEIEVFYTLLSTQDCNKDLMFGGRINDLPKLFEKENLRLTPSLIYPKERNWVINTDYDLSFSTIGGETKLIDELAKQNKNEIFKVEY